jgi:hypothetical protein
MIKNSSEIFWAQFLILWIDLWQERLHGNCRIGAISSLLLMQQEKNTEITHSRLFLKGASVFQNKPFGGLEPTENVYTRSSRDWWEWVWNRPRGESGVWHGTLWLAYKIKIVEMLLLPSYVYIYLLLFSEVSKLFSNKKLGTKLKPMQFI